MRWYGVVSLFYILVMGLFYQGYVEKKQFNYPSKTFFQIYGLDVSHHQGKINWDEVGKTDFKFVYIKATEGESFKDPNFLKNYRKAKKQKMIVGGYHFWTFCKTAQEQIKNIQAVIPYSAGDLILAIDMESVYSCGKKKSHDRVTRDLEKINERLFKIYGVYPVIYTTGEFVKVHPEILKFPNIFWQRSLFGPPLYKRKWGIWQYYNRAKVKGIKGGVDVNVFNSKLLFSKIIQK